MRCALMAHAYCFSLPRCCLAIWSVWVWLALRRRLSYSTVVSRLWSSKLRMSSVLRKGRDGRLIERPYWAGNRAISSTVARLETSVGPRHRDLESSRIARPQSARCVPPTAVSMLGSGPASTAISGTAKARPRKPEATVSLTCRVTQKSAMPSSFCIAAEPRIASRILRAGSDRLQQN